MLARLILSLELARVDALRQLYRGFTAIYERHVMNAKFDVVKGEKFKSLKENVAFARHLLNEHRDIGPEKRTELVRALFTEGVFRHTRPKSRKNRQGRNGKTSLFKKLNGILPRLRATNEESLRSEMKNIADSISDADFLLELKGVENEDLGFKAQEVVGIAHTQLTSLIDATVNQMACDVLGMQEEECKRKIQHEIKAKQREVLSVARMKFIRDINSKSTGQRTS
jgi:hypothetical protein